MTWRDLSGAVVRVLPFFGPRAPLASAEAVDGNCDIREHTADGAYVGRCEFATHDHCCPRHGMLVDYPTRDDREVAFDDRRFGAKTKGKR